MASTLGVTTGLASVDNNDPNTLVVSGPFTVGSDTKIQNGEAFQISGGSGSQKVRMVVYGDSGDGVHPSTTPLGASDEVNVPASTSALWIVFPFSTSVTLSAGTKVWIGLWWGTHVSSYDFYVSSGAGPTQYYNLAVPYASSGLPPTTPWTANTDGQQYSTYFNMVSAGVAQTVPVPSVYPSGYAPTIVSTFYVSDGHVVDGVPGTQFGTVTAKYTPKTATPSGLGSAQAFGTLTIKGGIVKTLGGVPSAQAFGTPTTKTTAKILPVGLGSAQLFGVVLTVTAGKTPVFGLGSAQAFGMVTAKSSTAPQTAVVAGLGSVQSFGLLTISGKLVRLVGGVASAQAFSPLTPVPKTTVTVLGLQSAQLFGAPGASTPQFVSVLGVSSAGAFGIPAAFHAWLHVLYCLTDIEPTICDVPTICGTVICGGGLLYLHQAGSSELSLAPSLDESLDLQPVGCG